MIRLISLCCAFVSACLVAGSVAAARIPQLEALTQDQDRVAVQRPGGGWRMVRRCGVEGQEHPPGLLAEMRRSRLSFDRSPVHVPVVLHVISNSKGEGALSDGVIAEQMRVLEAAYEPHDIFFELELVDRVVDDVWFKGNSESVMRASLAVDPLRTLNIYTYDLGEDSLGYTYMPWDFPEDDYRHGVTVYYGTFPGEQGMPYNEGDTLVHEVGHYFGLLHTFQRGCKAPGDFLPDTPYEKRPGYGCPVGRDTCPNRQGEDPIHNYMDYSEDGCMDHFTPQQGRGMHYILRRFRPGLLE